MERRFRSKSVHLFVHRLARLLLACVFECTHIHVHIYHVYTICYWIFVITACTLFQTCIFRRWTCAQCALAELRKGSVMTLLWGINHIRRLWFQTEAREMDVVGWWGEREGERGGKTRRLRERVRETLRQGRRECVCEREKKREQASEWEKEREREWEKESRRSRKGARVRAQESSDVRHVCFETHKVNGLVAHFYDPSCGGLSCDLSITRYACTSLFRYTIWLPYDWSDLFLVVEILFHIC